MDRWMDGWRDGWRDGGMEGWRDGGGMDGCMDHDVLPMQVQYVGDIRDITHVLLQLLLVCSPAV